MEPGSCVGYIYQPDCLLQNLAWFETAKVNHCRFSRYYGIASNVLIPP